MENGIKYFNKQISDYYKNKIQAEKSADKPHSIKDNIENSKDAQKLYQKFEPSVAKEVLQYHNLSIKSKAQEDLGIIENIKSLIDKNGDQEITGIEEILLDKFKEILASSKDIKEAQLKFIEYNKNFKNLPVESFPPPEGQASIADLHLPAEKKAEPERLEIKPSKVKEQNVSFGDIKLAINLEDINPIYKRCSGIHRNEVDSVAFFNVLMDSIIDKESTWIQEVASKSGAIGYMQVMPRSFLELARNPKNKFKFDEGNTLKLLAFNNKIKGTYLYNSFKQAKLDKNVEKVLEESRVIKRQAPDTYTTNISDLALIDLCKDKGQSSFLYRLYTALYPQAINSNKSLTTENIRSCCNNAEAFLAGLMDDVSVLTDKGSLPKIKHFPAVIVFRYRNGALTDLAELIIESEKDMGKFELNAISIAAYCEAKMGNTSSIYHTLAKPELNINAGANWLLFEKQSIQGYNGMGDPKKKYEVAVIEKVKNRLKDPTMMASNKEYSQSPAKEQPQIAPPLSPKAVVPPPKSVEPSTVKANSTILLASIKTEKAKRATAPAKPQPQPIGVKNSIKPAVTGFSFYDTPAHKAKAKTGNN